MFTFCLSLPVEWDSCAGVQHLLLSYDLATVDILTLQTSQVARGQHSGFKLLVPIPIPGVIWMSALAYALMERRCAKWCAANGKVVKDDVPKGAGVPFVDELDMKTFSNC